jgi:hypothetical protein
MCCSAAWVTCNCDSFAILCRSLLLLQAAEATGIGLSDLDLQHILSSQCHVKAANHALCCCSSLQQAAEATGIGLSDLDL